MPISKKAGEDKESFISRCIAKEVGSGKSEEQAAAICYNIWEGGYNEPPVSVEFKKSVLLSEDTDEDIIKSYIDRGFKPHFLSKRKIRKKDKKVWNKIKKFNLNPELDLKFGKVDPNNYDEVNLTGDVVLDKLVMMGRQSIGKVIKTSQINSMSEAIEFEKSVKDIDLKFVTVKVYYRYAERTDVPPAKTGSRTFCSGLMKTPDKLWTLEEIQSLNNGFTEVGDVFLYRGGFYNNPDTGVTTPFCRHQWIAEVRIEP